MADGGSTSFSNTLQRLRLARGLSIYALARLSGVSRGWLGRLERGVAGPSLEVARRVAHGLGVGLAEFDITDACTVVDKQSEDSGIIP